MTGACAVCENAAMPAKLPPRSPVSHRVMFARRLSAAREAAGYPTMREFADALGVSEARYRRWEAAETEPDLFYLQKIARMTGASLDTLISGDRRPPAAA
jgi:transcriptional regulator with XRE-family HTH domain